MKHFRNNPRKISKAQIERLKKTMQKYGDLSGITHILETDELITGNQRSDAGDFINQKPIIEQQFNPPLKDGTVAIGYFDMDGVRFNYRAVQGWTTAEQQEANLIANAAGGDWDWKLLETFPVELLNSAGFDEDMLKGDKVNLKGLQNFVDSQEPAETVDAEPQIDRAEELLKKWKVQTGDLWQIGEHRLICGDCTDAAVVARVMGGEKADMLFTSPPYAAQRDYEIGDFDWLGLMLGMSEQAIENMKDNASILVNLGLVHKDGRVDRYWDEWIDWMEDNAQPLYGWYVWDKLSGLMGDWKGRLAPAHEWIFHFAKQPRKANKTAATKYAENGVTRYKKDKVGLRGKDGTMKGFTSAGKEVNQTKVIDSVIRCQPQRGGIEGHPAPFSVAFAESLVEVYANISELVYEPFSGSGTTLVACQNLSRRGRAIEISPAYCAVTLERMATAFPHLEIKRL